MCEWADEQERRQLQHEPQTTESDDPCLLWADAATVRAAVLDVIDAGEGGWWELYDDRSDPERTEDDVNLQRSNFAAAVQWRIRELQQLHNYPQLANYCDFHKRRRLPLPTTFVCADCERQAR